EEVDLTGSWVYGISAWDINLTDSIQRDLVITPENQPVITVDDLEMAQFVQLMLYSDKIDRIINTIGRQVVLILGRFDEESKPVLNAIRNELRQRDYLPVTYDFEQPQHDKLTESVTTLARMARFVIADITDARSILPELQAILPLLPSLPVQPIILETQYDRAMFRDFQDCPGVLLPYLYKDREDLIATLADSIIDPAQIKANEFDQRRQEIEALLETEIAHTMAK
ncbi:MAG TPA: pentapeptide repeat-containing protein, partial [Anaerolineae bacterium]|nr:pentapeptide repeat-containing protein [Anaerolineae bacterium]